VTSPVDILDDGRHPFRSARPSAPLPFEYGWPDISKHHPSHTHTDVFLLFSMSYHLRKRIPPCKSSLFMAALTFAILDAGHPGGRARVVASRETHFPRFLSSLCSCELAHRPPMVYFAQAMLPTYGLPHPILLQLGLRSATKGFFLGPYAHPHPRHERIWSLLSLETRHSSCS